MTCIIHKDAWLIRESVGLEDVCDVTYSLKIAVDYTVGMEVVEAIRNVGYLARELGKYVAQVGRVGTYQTEVIGVWMRIDIF